MILIKLRSIILRYLLAYFILIKCNIISSIKAPEELVNLLSGTFTDGDRFSTGNTLPLVGRPWGFNHWYINRFF